jgi:hypothetical protein
VEIGGSQFEAGLGKKYKIAAKQLESKKGLGA